MSGNERPRDLDLKNDPKPSLIPNTGHTMHLSDGNANSNGFDFPYMKIMKAGGSGYHRDITAQAQSEREENTSDFAALDSGPNERAARLDNFPSSMDHVTESKSMHSPRKINDNATTASVLRYALHLRFLCLLPKKCSRSVQKCKSNSLSELATTNMDIQGERRFYLYNNLRVVFPQRHTDADEGEVLCIIYFCFCISC